MFLFWHPFFCQQQKIRGHFPFFLLALPEQLYTYTKISHTSSCEKNSLLSMQKLWKTLNNIQYWFTQSLPFISYSSWTFSWNCIPSIKIMWALLVIINKQKCQEWMLLCERLVHFTTLYWIVIYARIKLARACILSCMSMPPRKQSHTSCSLRLLILFVSNPNLKAIRSGI